MKTLHLTVTKEWFEKILNGGKKEDFREIKPYWIKRLVNKFGLLHTPPLPPVVPNSTDFLKYDLIKIVNGYGEDKPTIIAKFNGLRITDNDELTDLGTGCFFAIAIGEFVEVNNINIATISGGKDSTVMCDLLLKNNYPVHYIVFKDTLHEFDEMYKYIQKVNEYFKLRYKKEITFLKPTKTLEDMVFGKLGDRSEFREGWLRGLPMPIGFPCWWRREAKNYPFDKWLKRMKIKKHKIYIGFTTDEPNRKMQGDNFLYPLIDNFKMSEKACQEYLINQEMENSLYKFFTRTGCSFCPAQSDRSFFQVWKHFPKEWEYMKKIEKELFEAEENGETVQNKYWFNGKRTCKDMENQFKAVDKQGSLFDFSDEPLKDCFCKI